VEIGHTSSACPNPEVQLEDWERYYLRHPLVITQPSPAVVGSNMVSVSLGEHGPVRYVCLEHPPLSSPTSRTAVEEVPSNDEEEVDIPRETMTTIFNIPSNENPSPLESNRVEIMGITSNPKEPASTVSLSTILSDPNLDVEDRVLALMSYLN
jgi:hypothetical protein